MHRRGGGGVKKKQQHNKRTPLSGNRPFSAEKRTLQNNGSVI